MAARKIWNIAQDEMKKENIKRNSIEEMKKEKTEEEKREKGRERKQKCSK